jgi:hypothetical protein
MKTLKLCFTLGLAWTSARGAETTNFHGTPKPSSTFVKEAFKPSPAPTKTECAAHQRKYLDQAIRFGEEARTHNRGSFQGREGDYQMEAEALEQRGNALKVFRDSADYRACDKHKYFSSSFKAKLKEAVEVHPRMIMTP